jgi:hypothetical protein
MGPLYPYKSQAVLSPTSAGLLQGVKVMFLTACESLTKGLSRLAGDTWSSEIVTGVSRAAEAY